MVKVCDFDLGGGVHAAPHFLNEPCVLGETGKEQQSLGGEDGTRGENGNSLTGTSTQ